MNKHFGFQTLESMSQAVWYNKWTLEKFKSFLEGKILEVGCGIGNFTDTLKNYGQVYAIDVNKKYLNEISKIVGSHVKIGYGDIEKNKYFFKNEKFDCIICLNVLEHIKDDRVALKNMRKLLKMGGHLILLVPAFKFLFGQTDRSIGHLRRYEKVELIEILKNTHFTIVQYRVINFLGAIGWWISSKLLSNEKIDENKIKIFDFIAPAILTIEDIIQPPFGTSILVIAEKK